MGGYVMHECMSSVRHILQEDVLHRKTCLAGEQDYLQVLLEGMSYRSV